MKGYAEFLPVTRRSLYRRLAWLAPFGALYGAAAALRRKHLARRAWRAPAPVISVGNLTLGGTGKTPAVEMVARDLLARGRKPAVLSRGYRPLPGRTSERGPRNDEALLLEENLPEVPVYTGADRIESARRALAGGADVLILDDGFQHVRLARDFDVVLLDALDPFGGGRVFPAGRLREPPGVLSSADLAVWTRTELRSEEEIGRLVSALSRGFPGVRQATAVTEPTRWYDPEKGREFPVESLSGACGFAFCAIGNPRAFAAHLRQLGIELRGWRSYSDHHRYRREEIRELAEAARRSGADYLLTTQKDAVKLRDLELAACLKGLPLRALKIRFALRAGRGAYERALGEALQEGDRRREEDR